MFETYEVGKRYNEAIGHAEGILFDITDAGILIPVYMASPRPDEIAEMKADKPIKMAYLAKDDVIIILAKFGNMAWMDAPYTPHLSVNLTHIDDDIEPGTGIATHLLLFDSATGELKTQRLFSMREKFSNDLIREIKKIKSKPFNHQAYVDEIRSAYRFSDDDLAKQAKTIYRIQ